MPNKKEMHKLIIAVFKSKFGSTFRTKNSNKKFRSKVENDYIAPKILEEQNPEVSARDVRKSPDSPDSGGSGGSGSIPGSLVAGGFIETPVYTFTLPDLTCYQGSEMDVVIELALGMYYIGKLVDNA
jgi:hypothetical protein